MSDNTSTPRGVRTCCTCDFEVDDPFECEACGRIFCVDCQSDHMTANICRPCAQKRAATFEERLAATAKPISMDEAIANATHSRDEMAALREEAAVADGRDAGWMMAGEKLPVAITTTSEGAQAAMECQRTRIRDQKQAAAGREYVERKKQLDATGTLAGEYNYMESCFDEAMAAEES